MYTRKVKIYAGFERFWHWTQAALIIFLALSGFEVHGAYTLFGYEKAVMWHDYAAWAFLVLIVFAIFWHITTGAWRQYIPTTHFIKAQLDYYLFGIFRNAPHPTKKTTLSKLNPLQRLTYFGLKILVIPVQVISGFLYLYYHQTEEVGLHFASLSGVAMLHTFGAFVLVAFIFMHIYLATTGTTWTSNIKAMITGWEEVELSMDEVREEVYPEVVKTSEMGYYFLDRDGYIRDVNAAWLRIYGYSSPEEVIGRNSSMTRKPEDAPALREMLERVLAGEKIESRIVERVGRDGRPGRHLLTAHPVYISDKIVGMAGFIVDESKNIEQEAER